jgi:hypothetical protein
MECQTRGCFNEAEPGKRFCRRCWDSYRSSRRPLDQGRRDVERHRHSGGHFQRSSSVEVEREDREGRGSRREWERRSVERELPSKKREHSPSPSPSSSSSRDRSRSRSRSRSRDWRRKQPRFVETRRTYAPPPVVGLPLLFVPFEGNFSKKMMGGYQSKGNQQSSMFEGRDFSPFIERGRERIELDEDDEDMSSSFGSSSHWKGRKGELVKHDLLSGGKKDLLQKLKKESLSNAEFFQLVVEDRLRYLRFTPFSEPAQGLPEVIVLSERLLEWPDRLRIFGRDYYRCHVLGGRNLQDMAAYTLSSMTCAYAFEILQRKATHKGKGFTETWMLVHKLTVFPALTVACVHLSSKYTSVTSSNIGPILRDLLGFARVRGILAIMGDFNMNTYGVYGGAFPTTSEFVTKEKSLSLKTTFATSSGGGDNVYMGGMICDSRVSFRPTLTSFGNCAVPPWFTGGRFGGRVFSDHHSLYCRYAFYTEGSWRRRYQPTVERGGDCFFVALRQRIDTLLGVDALRRSIIDAIRTDVEANVHIAVPRSVLVQVPNTDSAIPVWCTTRAAYMNRMRQPGTWVEDTIIPYIAVHLNRRFIVQYEDNYAVFDATDGTRTDSPGVAPLILTGIRMHCQGNHFW